ncbi:MAG: Membrane protein involved in the export of O-antigen and teichoic acid [Herbinix sp.]|jgi:hypothetical protein|nr:Membrane protein involved in the export of O-antigen and teichoic acid [Herbinix sp.]
MKRISSEQSHLINILKSSLHANALVYDAKSIDLSRLHWEKILMMAKNHAVLSLLYDTLNRDNNFPRDMFNEVQKISRQVVLQNYRLLYLTNYIVKLLEYQQIKVIVLKGAATANLYPVPELRKAGDIDLLVARKEDFQRACDTLQQQGFEIQEEQTVNHHLVFKTKDGVEIELHTMLAEPFDSPRVNKYLSNLALEYYDHSMIENVLGSYLPVPEDAYHAFHLLLHMLQHYLGSGFGLKLLCDWVVFWNRDVLEKDVDKFHSIVNSCGLNGFMERVTATCVYYLGLEEHRVRFLDMATQNKEGIENFMMETLESEEFGKSSADRMLVLRGTSPFHYVREFHHQMCLNYLTASKFFILWPVLWIMTLLRFLNNNRKIRKTSLWAILHMTNIRSKNKENLHLFQANQNIKRRGKLLDK